MSYPDRIDMVRDPDGSIDSMVPPVMAAEFLILVRRACSTWQEVSPRMRDFADRLLGVQHIMGENMKPGLGLETKGVVIVSETKSGVMSDAAGNRYKLSESLRLRDCCHTSFMEPHHTQCQELAKVATHVKPIGTLCDGHPETCNCPKHCR